MRLLAFIAMSVGLAGGHALAQAATNAPVSAATNAPSRFRSAEDGWLDVSGFLDEEYGFLPVVLPITEPAVGYGAAGGLMFDTYGCPKLDAQTSMSAVSGLKTGGYDFKAFNALAIVISVDKALVTKGGPLLGVWACTNK